MFEGRIKLYSSIKPQPKASSTNGVHFDNELKCYWYVTIYAIAKSQNGNVPVSKLTSTIVCDQKFDTILFRDFIP